MKHLILVLALLFAASAQAASPGVYEKSVKQALNVVYDRVNSAFEDGGFRVVYEVDIAENLSKIAGKLGKDYNQNKLEGIRSMVFCNGPHVTTVRPISTIPPCWRRSTTMAMFWWRVIPRE